MTLACIAFIGFGEAGGILAHDLAAQGLRVQAYDRLLDDPAHAAALQAKAQASGVQLLPSAQAACEGAQWVISAVTAGAALEVARQAAAFLRPGQQFIDINSVAPNTKREACTLITASGAGYIDAAVMAPVPPKRLQTPILLGGSQATALSAQLNALGLSTRMVSEQIGVASAIKMCRSIMIKGLEALTTECVSTARQYGAEAEVLASLDKSFPHMGWGAELPSYLVSRVAEHGRRRAEEMQEVVRTAQDVGVAGVMSQAIVHTQRGLVERMAAEGLHYAELEPFQWQVLVDRLGVRD